MCDYSLKGVANRPAKVADKLVLIKFPGTGTRGFVSPSEKTTAVCLLPGTELALADPPPDQPAGLLRRIGTWLQSAEVVERRSGLARFTKVHPNFDCVHHDAVEFPGGEVLSLQKLALGTTVNVLQLPVDADAMKSAMPVDRIAEMPIS